MFSRQREHFPATTSEGLLSIVYAKREFFAIRLVHCGSVKFSPVFNLRRRRRQSFSDHEVSCSAKVKIVLTVWSLRRDTTLPMLFAIAAVLFSGERLHFGGWVALVASTAGAGLIALSSQGGSATEHASLRGDLLVVASKFAAISWILISKRLMRRHTALMVTASVYGISTLMLAGVVATKSGVPSLQYSSRVWIAVAEQGILATASTTVLWNWGLKWVPASQAGIFVNLEPLVGTILGVSILHEVLGRMALAGGALIIGGALYFSRKPVKRKPA